MNDVDFVYDALIKNGYFTEKELDLVLTINGYSILTINDCIYARYGVNEYSDLDF